MLTARLVGDQLCLYIFTGAEARASTASDRSPSKGLRRSSPGKELSWSASPGQGATVTYAFRATASDTMPLDASGFTRLSSQQIDAVQRALDLWPHVANAGPLWGTIRDGGGIDTLDFGGSSSAERIDLNAGHFSDVDGGHAVDRARRDDRECGGRQCRAMTS